MNRHQDNFWWLYVMCVFVHSLLVTFFVKNNFLLLPQSFLFLSCLFTWTDFYIIAISPYFNLWNFPVFPHLLRRKDSTLNVLFTLYSIFYKRMSSLGMSSSILFIFLQLLLFGAAFVSVKKRKNFCPSDEWLLVLQSFEFATPNETFCVVFMHSNSFHSIPFRSIYFSFACAAAAPTKQQQQRSATISISIFLLILVCACATFNGERKIMEKNEITKA